MDLDLRGCLGRVKCLIAKLHRLDLAICSHSRERKTLPYSQISGREVKRIKMILSPLIIIKANYFKLYSIRLVVCVRQFTDRQSIICDKKPQLNFFKLPKYRKYGILTT